MAYAVVIGLIFGFVVEATGSIIPTMIMHFLINGFSVVIKHIANIIPALKDQAENTEVTQTIFAQYHPGIYTYGTGWHCNISRNYLSACSHKWQKGELLPLYSPNL